MAQQAVHVGVRELKNRLTSYLKLVKADREVIVTEHGTPIAVIGSIKKAVAGRSLDAKLAALAVKGEIQVAEHPLKPRVRRVKVAGGLVSARILADRR
jgi:prevent-host-death family protein